MYMIASCNIFTALTILLMALYTKEIYSLDEYKLPVRGDVLILIPVLT